MVLNQEKIIQKKEKEHGFISSLKEKNLQILLKKQIEKMEFQAQQAKFKQKQKKIVEMMDPKNKCLY